jgi:hypothetical protein
MSKKLLASGFWTYVAECVRLLYGLTSNLIPSPNWLRDIHPKLKPRDNPFVSGLSFAPIPACVVMLGRFGGYLLECLYWLRCWWG